MGKALYRKYRSKSLSEIVGQDHITRTLKQAIKQGRISHAYLLTGPRGVGKTSVARILAHEINNLPYEDDSSHIDIIEIDAASNRRIDEIRELREKVYMAPVSAKYKVYIIDEVHMLTKEAFNALLKTLEEPPEHVVFILATTDAHKLPETIISRTQRFTFKPVDKQTVINHLKHIADEEGVKVEPEALELLAEHGEGSFRDSISLLDQASSHGGKLTGQDVHTLLGIPPEKGVSELISNLESGSLNSMAVALGNIYDQGFQAAMIAKQLAARLREQLLSGTNTIPTSKLLDLLAKLIDVPAAYDPEKFLEILLLSFTPVQESREPVNREPAKAEPLEAKSEVVEAPASKSKPSKALNETVWKEVLADLKQTHNTLYGVVRMAKPDFSQPGVLVLAFAFDFHKKRLSEAQNQAKLAKVISKVCGQDVVIECIVDKNLEIEAPITAEEPADELKTISNIFGGAELLE